MPSPDAHGGTLDDRVHLVGLIDISDVGPEADAATIVTSPVSLSARSGSTWMKLVILDHISGVDVDPGLIDQRTSTTRRPPCRPHALIHHKRHWRTSSRPRSFSSYSARRRPSAAPGRPRRTRVRAADRPGHCHVRAAQLHAADLPGNRLRQLRDQFELADALERRRRVCTCRKIDSAVSGDRSTPDVSST